MYQVPHICVISSFRHRVDDICVLLGLHAA